MILASLHTSDRSNDRPWNAKNRSRRASLPAAARPAAALAEFAIVMPLLLLILVFLIDFSRAYVVAKAIDNAVEQGALTGSTTSMASIHAMIWKNRVEQSVRQSLSIYPWYQANRLTVDVPIPSTSNGMVDAAGIRVVQVRAVYTANHVLRMPGLPANYTVTRTARVDQIR